MAKTFGFYLLEEYLRKHQALPIPQGLHGFGPTILIGINLILGSYPFISDIINYKINFAKCLSNMEIYAMGVLLISINVQLFRNRHRFFKLINLLSDFNQVEIQRVKCVETNLKILFKTMRFASFFIAYFMIYYGLLNDDCGGLSDYKNCLVIEYYVPFDGRCWVITLILLFQAYTIYATIHGLLIAVTMCYYSLELLTVRIEHLNDMVKNIQLTRNKERNFKKLRPIILYHQRVLRMFQFLNGYLSSFFVPTKFFTTVCLTLTTVKFIVSKDSISFLTTITCLIGMFAPHNFVQKFITAADGVGDEIYNLNWYEADAPTRKIILIFLHTTQKALAIELPFFGQFSHVALGIEYKRVYILYNWILTIMK